MSEHKFTIALAGNPNCGKTTLFNALTGSNQHVGNYSGVTVEKKDGTFELQTAAGLRQINVIDLPGTYSLNYHSPEERVAQEEILSGNIDLLVAVVDTGALSRGLIFVSQLMQLGLPIILCLNMFDEAEKSGLEINLPAMRGLLGFPVIPLVASKGRGVDELRQAIAEPQTGRKSGARLRLGDTTTVALDEIIATFPEDHRDHAAWAATRLLLGDAKYTEAYAKLEGGKNIIATAERIRKHIEADAKMDIQLYLTEQYYGFVDGMLKEVVINKQRADARATSDRIDKVLAHPWLGLPFFGIIVFLLFKLTFAIGDYPMQWIEMLFEWLKDLIVTLWPTGHLEAIRSLLVDGIIGGVGGVIVFLPNILILFLGLSFLEDCGYMARSAFLMDKLMHMVGLHGRSFIPLITGFGCTVPGIMAARTIAGEKERLTTMFILPLMSCGARIPIWLLLVPCFFPQAWNAEAMFCIYLFGILIALVAAKCLRKTVMKGEEEPFVMELPPYRMPTLHATVTHMLERAWLYLKKAGTIILGVSIVLWALGYFPKMDQNTRDETQNAIVQQINIEYESKLAPYQDLLAPSQLPQAAPNDADETTNERRQQLDVLLAQKQTDQKNRMREAELEYSALGHIGKFIEPVFRPMGFDWKIDTAILGAFAAKEVFVSQMGIIYSLGEDIDTHDPSNQGAASLRATIRNTHSFPTGLALIIWLLISTPCMATFAVMKRETNSWKYAFAQFFGLTLFAYLLATLVYQIGSLFV